MRPMKSAMVAYRDPVEQGPVDSGTEAAERRPIGPVES